MKKITVFAGLVFALFASNANAQADVLGKNEFGRIFDLTYSLKEQNTIYAITLSSHIVVSKDNGNTWEVFYSLPNIGGGVSISKLNISKDGTFLSFATIQYGIGVLHVLDIPTKTIKKTYSLPNVSEGPYVSGYNFFGSDIDNLIVISQFPYGLGTANRVYTTADGGENWKEIYYSVEDNNNIITSYVAFAPEDKNKIYLANGGGSEGVSGGLMISKDAGDTFTEKLSGSILSTLEFNPNNPNELYAGTGISFGMAPEKLHHTTDGGETWEDKNITFGTNGILNNIIDIKFDPKDNNHVIVLEEDEIISTKDGGNTWQNVEYTYDNLDSYYYGIKASFNPFKTGEMVITANYKPLFTSDNAETLTQIQTPFYSSTGRVSLFKNETSKHLYYNVQGGFVHRNLADNSESAHNIVPLNIFSNNNTTGYLPDAEKDGRIYSFAGGFSGSVLSLSDDYGANFEPIFETFSAGLTSVTPDPQVTNQIWTTFNNWGQGELNKINFNDKNNIVVTNIALPSQNPVFKMLHLNNNSNEFLILIGSEIYKTQDGGETWTPVNIGNEITPDAFVYDITQDKNNSNHLAIGTSAGVFTSVDNGATWKNVSNFVANQVVYSDVNTGVLIATTHTSQDDIFDIHYSVNNGDTWKTVERADLLETESGSITVDFSDKKAYIYIASFDIGLLGYNLNLEILANDEVTAQKAQVLVYPNPVVDFVKIDVQNFKSASLYDMNGKKILESNKTEINVSQLPKGVYVLRIVTSDNNIVSKKIIKK